MLKKIRNNSSLKVKISKFMAVAMMLSCTASLGLGANNSEAAQKVAIKENNQLPIVVIDPSKAPTATSTDAPATSTADTPVVVLPGNPIVTIGETTKPELEIGISPAASADPSASPVASVNPSASPAASIDPSASPASSSKLTITFDGNGGTVNEKDKTRTLKKGKKLGKLPKATRKGYKFAGWYTEATDGTKVTKKTLVAGDEDYSVYAQWTKVKVPKVKNFQAINKRTRHIYIKYSAVSDATGYQVSEATVKTMQKDHKFFSNVTKGYLVNKGKKVVFGRGRVFYYRVRAYKMDSTDSKVYGKWSDIKRVRVSI